MAVLPQANDGDVDVLADEGQVRQPLCADADGAAGDALLSVTVADDPDWRRDGDDVVTTLPIALDEAVLGGPEYGSRK